MWLPEIGSSPSGRGEWRDENIFREFVNGDGDIRRDGAWPGLAFVAVSAHGGVPRYRTIRGLNALVNTAPLFLSYSGEASSNGT